MYITEHENNVGYFDMNSSHTDWLKQKLYQYSTQL